MNCTQASRPESKIACASARSMPARFAASTRNPCRGPRRLNAYVKHWTSGEMCLRWTAAGMLEAEARFRKVQGYRCLANLAIAIAHDLLRHRQSVTHTTSEEDAAALTV